MIQKGDVTSCDTLLHKLLPSGSLDLLIAQVSGQTPETLPKKDYFYFITSPGNIITGSQIMSILRRRNRITFILFNFVLNIIYYDSQ